MNPVDSNRSNPRGMGVVVVGGADGSDDVSIWREGEVVDVAERDSAVSSSGVRGSPMEQLM